MSEPVGIIGVGLLGSALLQRLTGAGYGVVAYDVDPAAREIAARLGAQPLDSAESVARVRRLILSLPDSNIVNDLLREIASSIRPGTVILDTTTGDPENAVRLAAELAATDVAYLDTTIGGSSKVTLAGEAIVLCGGERAAFEKSSDLLKQLGREIFYVGPAGSGARMKLVLNLVLGLHRAVLAEGLAFAGACGLSPQTTLDVLKAGPAYSRAMDAKGAKMLSREFTPEARLSQHLKDVRLILEEGLRYGAFLPLSSVHRDILERVERKGHGAEDNSAVIRAYLPDR